MSWEYESAFSNLKDLSWILVPEVQYLATWLWAHSQAKHSVSNQVEQSRSSDDNQGSETERGGPGIKHPLQDMPTATCILQLGVI